MVSSIPPPLSRVAPRRPRILLVDDDPSVIRGLLRTLRNARPEFQINTAESGGRAVKALAELTYDVVVTDLQMPGGTGVGVLEALCASYPETARIVHSSQLESAEAPRLRELAHVVLAKPASEAELVAAIDLALERANNRLFRAG